MSAAPVTRLDVALSYVRRGWSPIPIPHREKAPRLDAWQKLRITEADASRYFNGERGNVGVLLGDASGGLVDVDLDTAEARIAARHLLPDTGAIFGRPGAPESHHLYLAPGATTERFQFDRATFVELRASGAQTVFPGSTHKLGEPIEWAYDNGPVDVEASELRGAVARVAAAAATASRWPHHGRHDAALALAGGLRRSRWAEEETREFIAAVVDAAGDEEHADRLRAVADTYREGGPTTGWTKLGELLSERLVQKVREWLGASAPTVELSGEQWESALVFATSGTLLNRLSNVAIILTQHPAWSGVLALDEFDGDRPRKLKAPPFERGRPGAWTDHDTVAARRWLEDGYALSLNPERMADGVLLAANQRRYHPVREWLESLAWDGRERVVPWLSDFLGAERSEYVDGIGSRLLVAMVARVLKPGCKFDYLAVLEGPQGIGKSTTLRILGREWYSDTPIDFRSKDRFEVLRARWIVELPELDSLERTDPERVKSFLSSATDRYRPSYGREARDYPRQCVLVGTTNASEYLSDATGNRRFWPIRCGTIRLRELEAVRDQLFAEAVHLYRHGAPWWVDVGSELGARCAEEQAKRVVSDPWEQPIADYLAGRATPVTVCDVLDCALGMKPERMNRGHAAKAAAILGHLGWRYDPRRVRVNGALARLWHPPC